LLGRLLGQQLVLNMMSIKSKKCSSELAPLYKVFPNIF